MPLFIPLVLFSSGCFLIYGSRSLFTQFMQQEFERFGLPHLRQLTGALEIAGAGGLMLGLFLPILGCVAASGLSLLMLLGFLVRLKIKDGALRALPALFFMALNLYLLPGFLKNA
jgi:hypothetical protein